VGFFEPVYAPKLEEILRSRKKRVEKLGYMNMNPVERGLVEDPMDWRWSSYSFYQGRGAVLVEMDTVE
jgi:hypothetical protein